jgi:hypothetical protein
MRLLFLSSVLLQRLFIYISFIYPFHSLTLTKSLTILFPSYSNSPILNTSSNYCKCWQSFPRDVAFPSLQSPFSRSTGAHHGSPALRHDTLVCYACNLNLTLSLGHLQSKLQCHKKFNFWLRIREVALVPSGVVLPLMPGVVAVGSSLAASLKGNIRTHLTMWRYHKPMSPRKPRK